EPMLVPPNFITRRSFTDLTCVPFHLRCAHAPASESLPRLRQELVRWCRGIRRQAPESAEPLRGCDPADRGRSIPALLPRSASLTPLLACGHVLLVQRRERSSPSHPETPRFLYLCLP